MKIFNTIRRYGAPVLFSLLCASYIAQAQIVNPSQPATGVPLAGSGISVAGQTVSVNYGVANSPFAGNMTVGGTFGVTGTSTLGALNAGATSATTLSASSTVSGAGFASFMASPPAIGSTVASTGAFTTLSASSTVAGTGFSNYLASPPAIGGTSAAGGSFTSLSSSGTVSGTGFSNYLASPPTIGGTLAGSGFYTSLSATAILKAYKPTTFGNYENAAANSITANSGVGQSNTNTQVNGTNAQGMATSVLPFDHVGQYLSNYAFVPVVTSGSTTYTATTVSDASITTSNTIAGMFIQTLHSPTYFVGQVQSVAAGVATVDGWFAKTTGTASTPANSTGAIINPNTKVFGQNVVVNASGNGTTTGANTATGIEYDISTGGTVGTPTASPKSGVWGIDVVSLQYQNIDIGVQVRGARNIGYFSNNAGGAGVAGFVSTGDATAFQVNDATGTAINVVKSAASVFSVDPTGKENNNGAQSYGLSAQQVTTSFVNIGPSSYTYGQLIYIAGFNISGGAQGDWLYMVRSGSAKLVSGDDNTGLTVLFQAVGNQLQIKTTSGTLQYVAKVVSVF